METIDRYFKDKTENLTFIELKENSFIELKGYIIKDFVPLPILASELIKGIKDGRYEDEIRINDIIEGIIYTMGADQNFPYLNEYKEILNAYDNKIADFIFFKAIKDLEDGKFDDGCIKLRALLMLDPKNLNTIFNYGLGIEGLAKSFIETEHEKSELFLEYSTALFESILETDKDFALAHYKLGYHYLYNEKYLKANLTWEKFISLSEDDLLVQEIRNEIDNIEDDVIYETGLTYLVYNEYEKSLDYLLKLMPRYVDNWNLNYSIGRCYIGLDKYDLAIDYIHTAIELNETNPDLYNELGIIYYNVGDIIKAIEIFTAGIDSCSDDYKLFFNRGMSYLLLEEYENALKDISEAHAIDPNEDIKVQKENLENILNKSYNK
ncbi:MAG: hypothetical protein RIN55_05935 [Tissierellaceae bacterium]|nr:hypothetical protein [Tissierellaceae bacterium]